MKVIFLDIDGVMNSSTTMTGSEKMWEIHSVLVERLNRIIERTGAKLVLSSTWRLDPDWREVMKKAGIAEVFLGITPRMPHPPGFGAEFMERGKEIEEWLSINPYGVKKYCIIDDDSDMLPYQKQFKTSHLKGGLTEEITEDIINYLNE